MNKAFIHTIQNLPQIFSKGWKLQLETQRWSQNEIKYTQKKKKKH